MTTGPRPGPPRPVVCPLPAVGRWTVYPRGGSVSEQRRLTIELGYCRIHEGPVNRTASSLAADPGAVGVELRLLQTELPPRQSLVGCSAPPLSLEAVAGCDRLRIAGRLASTVGGVDGLVALTVMAADRPPGTRLGNEEEVLQALLEASEHLEHELAVIARRLAARAGWQAVAACASRAVCDATEAEHVWGVSGGPLPEPVRAVSS